MNTQTLDVIGLKCPLPILRAKKALAQMQEGEVLTVLATDGGAPGGPREWGTSDRRG